MDTRSPECHYRCIQYPVVIPSILRISSLQSDHGMCAKGKKSRRQNPTSNPSMAIQTLLPLLCPLLHDWSSLLLNSETMLLPPSNQKTFKPKLNINKLLLAVCPLSGNASLNTKFLRGYPKSYSLHGAQEQNLSINPVGESGIAGVWNAKFVWFLVI